MRILWDIPNALESPTNNSLSAIRGYIGEYPTTPQRLRGWPTTSTANNSGLKRKTNIKTVETTRNLRTEAKKKLLQRGAQNSHTKRNVLSLPAATECRIILHSFPEPQLDRTFKHAGYKSDLSSEEDYLEKSYDTDRKDTNPLMTILPVHSRPVGPPHIGLR